MSEESRSALKAYFETDDIPTEAQYQNLIDSLVNRTDDYKTLTNPPTATDDSGSGYKVFDIVKVTSDSSFYMCFDNTVGAAVWKKIINPSDVLTKTNTTAYEPTSDYHPATKKYVDDNGGGAITEYGTNYLMANTTLAILPSRTLLVSKTISKTATYLITGTITFYNTSNDDRNVALYLEKDSSANTIGRATTSIKWITSATYEFASVTIIVSLTSGDVIRLVGAGSAANNNAAGSATAGDSSTSLTWTELLT